VVSKQTVAVLKDRNRNPICGHRQRNNQFKVKRNYYKGLRENDKRGEGENLREEREEREVMRRYGE